MSSSTEAKSVSSPPFDDQSFLLNDQVGTTNDERKYFLQNYFYYFPNLNSNAKMYTINMYMYM